MEKTINSWKEVQRRGKEYVEIASFDWPYPQDMIQP